MTETIPKPPQERIAKIIARAGLCSRREAERWIAAGRVTLNGEVLKTPAVTVSEKDNILVDDRPLPRKEPTRLFLYNKPTGLVVTDRDEKNRATIFDHLPAFMPRVVSVGRLDLNTEGLLLLTNDGELARYLELPQTGWSRRYRVRVHGSVKEAMIEKLAKGLSVEGIKYRPITAEIDSRQGANTWLTLTLREGKNREIRRVMAAFDLQVNRLIRKAFGPFNLGSLATGGSEEVKTRVMKDQIAGYFKSGKT